MSEVTDANFKELVLNSKIPVVIDFWAPWCGPCKMLSPVIEQLTSEYSGKVSIFKMNIDDNPNTPTSFGVRSIPTLIMFKDGKPVATKIGAASKQNLEIWIKENS